MAIVKIPQQDDFTNTHWRFHEKKKYFAVTGIQTHDLHHKLIYAGCILQTTPKA